MTININLKQMKQIKNLLLAAVLFIGIGSVAQAQVKIAHIDSQKLIASMPETKAMQQELKKVGQTYDTEYKSQVSALQAKLNKYGAEAKNQTDAENAKRQKEVGELQKKLQLYAKTADKELQQKQMDLLKPILDKAQKTIQEVAKAQGIKYVFDSSPGKGLIVFDGEDLLPAVKAKLGINN